MIERLILVDTPDYVLHDSGLFFQGPGIHFEHWEALGATLTAFERGVQWALGDWLLHAESRSDWADKYTQALDHTKIAPGTMKNYRWVAKVFPHERRRPTLSWSHHYEVASLAPDQQEEWLNEAEAQGWSSQQLRKQLRTAHGRDTEPAPTHETDPLERAKGAYLALEPYQREEFDDWLIQQRANVGG